MFLIFGIVSLYCATNYIVAKHSNILLAGESTSAPYNLYLIFAKDSNYIIVCVHCRDKKNLLLFLL
jgi:hypothetical protein